MTGVRVSSALDRISRCSQGVEGVWLGDLRIRSLLFSHDVILLASSGRDLRLSLEWFAAECEAAGMRISTSKSETLVHGKGWNALSGLGMRSFPKWRSSSISGSCL